MTQTAAYVFEQQWHYTSVSDGSFSIHRGPDGSGPDPVAHDIRTVEDARLIAAAPRMLLALKNARKALNEDQDVSADDIIEAIIATTSAGYPYPDVKPSSGERQPARQVVVALLDVQADYLLRLLAKQADEIAIVIADQIEQSKDDPGEPDIERPPLDGMAASVRRAAPQLLAALEGLLPEIEQEIEQRQASGDDEYWLGLDRLAADARDAIAKAKGLQDTQAGNPTPN